MVQKTIVRKPKKELTIDEVVDNSLEIVRDAYATKGGLPASMLVNFEWIKDGIMSDVVINNDIGFVVTFADQEMLDGKKEVCKSLGAAAALLQTLELTGAPTSVRLINEGEYMSKARGSKPTDCVIISGADSKGNHRQRVRLINTIVRGNKKDMAMVRVLSEQAPEEAQMDEVSIKNNDLEAFWDEYHSMLFALKRDGNGKLMTTQANDNPSYVFSFTIQTALSAARVNAARSVASVLDKKNKKKHESKRTKK